MRKRVWKTVLVAVLAGVALLGSLVYWKRYDLALWIMRKTSDAQEMVILSIQERAAPFIKLEVRMTWLQKLFSAMTNRRSEKERQADALDDVRVFNELSFENHRLYFDVAHGLDSLYGFTLHGFDFVLGWNRGNADEVLAEFDVDLLTRKLARMQINEDSSYFADLTLYIRERATAN